MSDLAVMAAMENLQAEVRRLIEKINQVSDEMVELTAELTQLKAKDQSYRPTHLGSDL